MISFELNGDEDIVEINVDDAGRNKLIDILQRLNIDNNNHVHLMTKEWGAGEIDDVPQNKENSIVNLVNIRIW